MESLPVSLQQARKARRLSQLELSLRMGVSQRHVSFVESGRARPSRDLLVAWLEELDAPLALRNEVMRLAGFAPVYSAAPLHHPALAQANEAMTRLLASHDPMPALLLDAQWNLLRLNQGCQWLAATLMPWTANVPAGTPMNMLDLLLHPEGLLRHVVNLAESGPCLLAHLRRDAAVEPSLAPRVEAFAAFLRTRLGSTALQQPAAPVLTTRFATPHGELAFFSMFTTFGTPHDITLASLRVEHLFPADEATRAVLQRRH